MLTQLPSGDWLELASIVHVTATEVAPGEWAVIGHTPGGYWINLGEPTVPDGIRGPGRLLKKEDAEQLRDQWTTDINKAKADAIEAEATERLTVLQEWRNNRRAERQAGEASTWQTPEVHTYRLDVKTGKSTLIDTSPLFEYHKSRNQPPPDPIYHCPRCGAGAPRSQWGVVSIGILPDGSDPRRCTACWFSGYSVVPHEGHRPGTATAERTDGGILLPSEQPSPCSPYSRDKITVEVNNEPCASLELRLDPTSLGHGEVLPPKATTVAKTRADEEAGENWRDRAIRDPLL